MALPDAYKTWKEAAQHIEKLKKDYTDVVDEVSAQRDNVDTIVKDSEAKSQDIETALTEATTTLKGITNVLTDARSRNQEIADSLEKVNTAVAQVIGATAELRKDRKTLDDLTRKAQRDSQTISELLKKATAVSLFHAFDATKTSHEDDSKTWRWNILGSLVALLIISAIFALTTSDFRVDDWLRKLLVTSPVIYWLILSTRRFSKAKRLQEEYAFKSALSLSLEAYRDLLQKEAGRETSKVVVPVITEAVGTIFTSPSETLSKHPHRDDKDIFEIFAETVQKVADKIPPR